MHKAREIKKNFVKYFNTRKRSETKEDVKFFDLVELHENSSTIFLALIVAALCLIPIPGTGTLFGWFLLILSFCFLFSYSVKVPDKINNLKLSKSAGDKSLLMFFHMWRFISKYSSSRFEILFNDKLKILWFIIWLTMSVLIILPIPFGNTIPAFTLIVLFISMIVKDGLFLISVPALSILSFIPIYLSFEVITNMIQAI